MYIYIYTYIYVYIYIFQPPPSSARRVPPLRQVLDNDIMITIGIIIIIIIITIIIIMRPSRGATCSTRELATYCGL